MLLNSVGCVKLKVNVKGFIINEMGMNKKTPFDTNTILFVTTVTTIGETLFVQTSYNFPQGTVNIISILSHF